MAIAFIQGAGNTAQASSCAKAFGSNNSAGNLLLCVVGCWKGTNTFNDPVITDTQGNAWVLILTSIQQGSGNHSNAYLFAAYNCKSGANTVTASGFGVSLAIDMAIHEYSGCATVSPRDQIAGGSQSVVTSIATGSISTQIANELVFSFAYDQSHGTQTFTPTAGWTLREQTSNPGAESIVTFDRLVASTGTYSNTISISSGNSNGLHAMIASFAAASITDNLVQLGKAKNGSTASLGVAFPSVNTLGDLLFLAVARWVFGTLGTITSVTDSQGNTWTLVASTTIQSSAPHGQSQLHLYACASCKAGTNTVTVATSSAQDLQLAAFEYLPSSVPSFSASAFGGGAIAANSVSTGNFPAQAGLMFTVAYNESANATIYSDISGTGWRQRVNQGDDNQTTLTAFDQIVPSPTTLEQTATVIAGSFGLHLIAGFAAAPPPPPPPLSPCVPVDGGGNLTGGTYIPDLSLFILPETALYTNPILPGAITTSELGNEGRKSIVLDFNNGDGLYARDLGCVLEWPTSAGIQVFVWQPSIIPMPEGIFDRASDWDDGGNPGAKFIQGVIVEAFSFGQSKTFFLQDSDTLTLHALNECPIAFAKQQEIAFSCVPFVAHSTRVISTDGVEWRVWKARIVSQPFPESTLNWQTELTSLGMTGWAHAREMNLAYLSTSQVTLTLTFDSIAPIVLTLPGTSGVQAKTKITLPPNKWKLIGFQASSTSPFRVFQGDIEVKLREWGAQGPYGVVKPFGGKSSAGALV